jgi:acetoacetyl-CoA synthetase
LSNPDSLDEIRDAVQRAEARPLVQVGQADTREADSTEKRLRAIWEEVLAVAPIGPDENFFDVWGTSLGAVRLLNAIHERLGVDLPLSVLMHAQTTEAMARVIDSCEDDDLTLVVPLRDGTSGNPVFIVHALIGDILGFRDLVGRLGTERPVYGIRAQGLDPRLPPHTSVEEMATEYVRQIRAVHAHGPVALAGYSFGGLVALEMARRFMADGEPVDSLILIDTYVHERCLSARGRAWLSVSRRFRLVVAGLRSPRKKFPRFVRRVLAGAGLSESAVSHGDEEVVLPPLLRYIEQVNTAAFESYCPDAYPGSALFVKASQRERRQCNPLPFLSRVVKGGLVVERVRGGHFDLMTEPWVQAVADRVDAGLSGSA